MHEGISLFCTTAATCICGGGGGGASFFEQAAVAASVKQAMNNADIAVDRPCTKLKLSTFTLSPQNLNAPIAQNICRRPAAKCVEQTPDTAVIFASKSPNCPIWIIVRRSFRILDFGPMMAARKLCVGSGTTFMPSVHPVQEIANDGPAGLLFNGVLAENPVAVQRVNGSVAPL